MEQKFVSALRSAAQRAGVRSRLQRIGRTLDPVLAPSIWLAGMGVRAFREIGVEHLPLSRKALRHAGVFPILDHYYEPLTNVEPLRGHLDVPRELPGLEWDMQAQLKLVERLKERQPELARFAATGAEGGRFAYDNGNFGPGDADVLYLLLRELRPKRVTEVGSGFSTLVASEAIRENRDQHGIDCDHLCVEPYEMPWLEGTGARVRRERLEDISHDVFAELEDGDVLFIDSSHMIRPRGDVLVLFQQIIPTLARGVWVHVHDIFTPRDYPERWVVDKQCFWNEQYLLEVFLAMNPHFRVELALNHLFHEERPALAALNPRLQEPGVNPPKSLWFRRTGPAS